MYSADDRCAGSPRRHPRSLEQILRLGGPGARCREAVTAQHAAYIATSEYGTNSILAFYLPRDVRSSRPSEAMRYTNLLSIDQSLLRRSTGLYLTSARRRGRTAASALRFCRPADDDRARPPGRSVSKRFGLYRLSGYRGGLPY